MKFDETVLTSAAICHRGDARHDPIQMKVESRDTAVANRISSGVITVNILCGQGLEYCLGFLMEVLKIYSRPAGGGKDNSLP